MCHSNGRLRDARIDISVATEKSRKLVEKSRKLAEKNRKVGEKSRKIVEKSRAS